MPRPKKVAKVLASPKEVLGRVKYLGDRLAVIDVLIDRLEGSIVDETGERKYPAIVANTFGDAEVAEAVIDEVVVSLQAEATTLKNERDELWGS